MKLEMRNKDGKFLGELNDETKTLQELNLHENSFVHIIDVTGNSPLIDLSSDINSRYVMTEEKYKSMKGRFSNLFTYKNY